MGAVNGVLVAGLGLPSIVVTLATMVILREALRWSARGSSSATCRPASSGSAPGRTAGQWLVVAIALAVFAAFAWGLRNLAAGRAVYATGSDAEAARLAGIRPRRVVFGVFVVDGGAGRPGRPAQRGPVRRRRPQRRARAWSCRSSPPSSSAAWRSPAGAARWSAR